MLTKPKPQPQTSPGPKATNPDPKELLKGLPGMTGEFIEDFLLGIEFGAFEQKTHFKWKYGNPWLYPAYEFPMLKTAIRSMVLVDIEKMNAIRTAKTDVAQALGITEELKEKNKKTAKSMASFFKDLSA